MKAIIKRGAESPVEIADMEKPAVAESDILVRILPASVCGSDVHTYEGTPGYEQR
jgi:D-arabinose 1-dehydrogenase-like Zn-dependent alcohol dehydrogenase